MTVDSYSFGKITIDGRAYSTDVIIWPDHVKSPWWRVEGHNLIPEDLGEVLVSPPEVLVIGTGCYGHMTVPPETLSELQVRGIEVHVFETGKAVTELNRLARECADIVAAFHLTC